MAVTQLATEADVAEAMGRDLTPTEAGRVDAILDKVSALFRIHAGQQFTTGESEVTVLVRSGVAVLPQRPVVEVASVTDAYGVPLSYSVRGGQILLPYLVNGTVTVAYSHGGDIPDLVRLTVADVVRKILSIPAEAQAGVQQVTKSTGPFSETHGYATWALGGQASLSPEDKKIAEMFRVRTGGTIRVQPTR